ncbi:beta strand repeat-containing protein, partial [Singulisphaera rosea]
YQFTGTAGSTIFLDNTAFTTTDPNGASGTWTLVDPFGAVIFSNEMKTDSGRLTLGATGTYTLVVAGDVAATGTASDTFNVRPVTDTTAELSLGTTVTGNVAVPGQVDNVTFTLATPTRVWFDSQTNDDQLSWTLRGPHGTYDNSIPFSSGDQNPGLLPAATYTISVVGAGDYTGGYSFNLLDVAGATSITAGTASAPTGAVVTGILSASVPTKLYKFDASAGDTLSFHNISDAGDAATWQLLDPFGKVLFKSRMGSDFGGVAIGATGTYTLVLVSAPSLVVAPSYSFQVNFQSDSGPATVTGTALTLGNRVATTLGASGRDNYQFTLSSPSRLWFDSQASTDVSLTLVGSQGTLVEDHPFASDDLNLGLLPAGAYSLRVSGASGTEYAFNVLDFAAATAVTPNADVSGTINLVGLTQLYSFSGTTGSKLFLDNTFSSPNAADWTLMDPFGATVFVGDLSTDSGRLTLGTTGTYTLVVQGHVDILDESSYTFNVRLFSDTTAELTVGTPVIGDLANPGQVNNYTFTLDTPTHLWFDSRTTDGELLWTLKGSQGTVVNGTSLPSGDVNVGLLPAGNYTLTVIGLGDSTGSYNFNLIDFAKATAITTGINVSGTSDPGNSANLSQFPETAGSTIYLDSIDFSTTDPSGLAGTWTLIDPVGKVVFNDSVISDSSRIILGVSGTYTLVVQGNDDSTGTSRYAFNVRPVEDTTTELTLGTAVDGNIASPGQANNDTFTLAAPTWLWFDSRTDDSNLVWTLKGPQGTAVSSQAFSSGDSKTAFLSAGIYTLTVLGVGDHTNGYAFRLLDMAASTPITPGMSASGTLGPANSTNLYQFSETAGSKVFVNFTNFSATDPSRYHGVWELFGPTGNWVNEYGFTEDAAPLTLPATGTYTLAVEGDLQESGTASYTFNVRPVTDTTTALTLGTAVNGNIGSPGQGNDYTFTLETPTRLWLDSRTNDGRMAWDLKGPEGFLAYSTPLSKDDQDLGLLPAGDYTFTIHGVGDHIGGFSFNILDLAGATTITAGTAAVPTGATVSGTLGASSPTKLYKFTASAGDTLAFHSISDEGDAATWQLINPSNEVLFQAGMGSDVGDVAIGSTEMYTLVLFAKLGDAVGPSYGFQVNLQSHADPTPVTGTALTLGSPVTGTVAAGGVDSYTFTLASPSRLWFDAQTNESVSLTLVGPKGIALISSDTHFENNDQNLGLMPAGTYLLQASGSAGAAYSFNLLDFAAATPVTPGTAVAVSLNLGDSTELYRFSGSVGATFYFDNISTDVYDSPYGQWSLLDPFGNQYFDEDLYQDPGRITLTSSGTFTLVVQGESYGPGTASFDFNIRPADDTTTALTLGTPVTGSVANPGQDNHFTFTLAAPAPLLFDTRIDSGSNLTWDLTGAAGGMVNNGYFWGYVFSLGLLPPDTYTLTVSADGDYTGSYLFNLLNFEDATTITPGTTTSGSLSPASPTMLYQFTGTAGSTIFLQNTALSTTDPGGIGSSVWTLIDPFGNQLSNDTLSDDPGRITLDASGTYTLVLLADSKAAGTESYTFNLIPVVDNLTQLWGTTGDDAITVRYLDATTRDVYLNGDLQGTLTGTAPLTIDGRGGNDTVTIIGTSASDTFTVTPTRVSLGGVAVALAKVPNLIVDGSGGDDTFNYSGDNAGLQLLGGAGLDTFG